MKNALDEDGDTDFIREFAHAARTDAEQECDKRKKRLESQRRKHAPDEEAGEDIGDGRPSKCARTDVKNRGSTATTVKHLRERRRTKTFEDRGEIVKARQGVVNVEPGLPKKSFKSWEEFEQVLHLYEAKHFLHFRVRSSETRARNNSRANATHIPERFSRSFKRMWCTHGSTQSSRGEGLRICALRYTGCEASFLVRCVKVLKQGITAWEVQVDSDTEI
ncbi:hypothetical protein F443_08845 [Phytophthora nicotianae P1569]|uniref:ZSWIM3 N-terminal domain-containing protein n=1 Tax=Phytophthora nicotianae P1569 TaxID=1317065 RepID=V9F5J5_PHYNI|nr:hypothetical protein F443_08845 [Phytophthora nicotianae P1569]